MNDLNIKEVSDICVACGMCCDGTLFGKANLSNEQFNDDYENVLKARDLNMNVFEENGKYFFKQPCHLFNTCCTVYNQVRPRVCGTYFCEPLKKYERAEHTLEQASKLIQQALALKAEILKTSKEFPELNNLLISEIIKYIDPFLEKSTPSDLKKYGKMIILTINFRNLKKEILNNKKSNL